MGDYGQERRPSGKVGIGLEAIPLMMGMFGARARHMLGRSEYIPPLQEYVGKAF